MAIPSEWAGPPVEWAGLPGSPTLPYLRVSKVCLMHPGTPPPFLFRFKVTFLIWTWCTRNVIKISLMTRKNRNLDPKKVL